MITFDSPEDPSVQFVMRVVGLPGEELAIREGAVWIDGKKIDPPDSLRGIEYSPDIEPPAGMAQGRGETPIKLEHDEYFVLGDFPDRRVRFQILEEGRPRSLALRRSQVERYRCGHQYLLATKSLEEFSLSAAFRRFKSSSPTPITIPTTASACHFIG